MFDVNWAQLYELCEPLIVCYGLTNISKDVVEGICLNHEYKPTKIKKVNIPPELKIESNEICFDELLKKKYGDVLVEFSKTVIEKIPNENLTNFYNNIKSLKTDKKTFEKTKNCTEYTVGSYNVKKNEIDIEYSYDKRTIFHELFHMSSAKFEKGVRYSGFAQTSFFPSLCIGKGINEGYTELMTDRYFDYDHFKCGGYKYATFIASRVEDFIGQEKMEELYLNSNLLGLINELKKYNTEKKVMKFITSTDFILNRFSLEKFIPTEKRKIKKSLKFINLFLIESYSNYIKDQLSNNKISDNKANLDMLVFTQRLYKNVEASNRNFNILSDNDIEKIVGSIFGNTDLLINHELEKIKTKKAA